MRIIRSRWQWFVAVGCVVALAPLLMAPDPTACPSCQTIASWEGALDPQESAPHWYQVQNGVNYFVYLDVESGSGSLGVSGQVVSQLSCWAVQSDTMCTFKAQGTGNVTMNATGGGQGAEYLLEIGYP
jgi:hypothetical protein